MRPQPYRPHAALLFVLVGLLVALTLANYRFAQTAPGGNDFLARWMGARYWLVEGISPYDDQVSLATQKVVYGRPADVAAGEDVASFVYPLPSMIFFGPFGLLPYTLARALWTTLLELSLPLLAVLSMRAAGWKPDRWMTSLMIVFSVLWYHGFRDVILGQFAALEAVLIAGALLAVQRRKDVLAGVLLGLTIAKPQMVYLLLPYILIWSAMQRRWGLFGAIIAGVTILVGGFTTLMPGWPLEWIRQLLAYPQYTSPGSPISIMMTILPRGQEQASRIGTVLLGIFLFITWLQSIGRSDRWFQWTAALTLVISNLILIRTATTNFLALFPGLCIILASWEGRWGRRGRAAIYIFLIAAFVGLWALFLVTVDGYLENPVMHLPLPLFILAGLLWSRWWYLNISSLPSLLESG